MARRPRLCRQGQPAPDPRRVLGSMWSEVDPPTATQVSDAFGVEVDELRPQPGGFEAAAFTDRRAPRRMPSRPVPAQRPDRPRRSRRGAARLGSREAGPAGARFVRRLVRAWRRRRAGSARGQGCSGRFAAARKPEQISNAKCLGQVEHPALSRPSSVRRDGPTRRSGPPRRATRALAARGLPRRARATPHRGSPQP